MELIRMIQILMGMVLKMEMMISQMIPTIQIQIRMVFLIRRKLKTEPILMIQILMGMVLTMEMMISLKIQTRIRNLMEMVKEIILIQMTMGTVFQMSKKKKMEQIQPIQTLMAMGLMTETKKRTELIQVIQILTGMA